MKYLIFRKVELEQGGYGSITTFRFRLKKMLELSPRSFFVRRSYLTKTQSDLSPLMKGVTI